MVGMSFLQECGIDKTKSATTCTNFFLHTHQLCEIAACFLRTQFISPLTYFFRHETNTSYTGNRPRNTEHQGYVTFNAGCYRLANLLIGYFPFLFWII